MRRRLVVLALVALVAAAGGGSVLQVAAHPTPPGSPTPTVEERTPTPGMGMRMEMAENGSVTNGNPDELPPGCEAIQGTKRVTIRAGVAYADGGEAFAFDTEEIQAPPCTRLVVTVVNEDDVRHQFMVHGLPSEVYPMGMFTIEVDGPGRVTGSFVTPAEQYRLHTHCSLPQHQQKGMLMEVVVGDGSAGLVGGPGHAHGGSGAGGAGHTHTAGGHSPSGGIGAPGFGLLGAFVGVVVAIILARRRGGV